MKKRWDTIGAIAILLRIGGIVSLVGVGTIALAPRPGEVLVPSIVMILLVAAAALAAEWVHRVFERWLG